MPPERARTARPRWRRVLRWFGRSLYLLLIQLVFGVITLGLLVYFAINSPSAAGRITDLVSDLIPGDLQVQAIRWGPSPGDISVLGVAIQAPGRRPVLAVREAHIQLAVAPLLSALAAGRNVLPLRIERLRLVGADVRIQQDEQGRLLLPQAFSDPDEPEDPKPGKPLALDVVDMAARDTTFFLEMPGIRLSASGADLKGSLSVRTHGDEVDVAYSARDIRIARAEVRPDAIAQLPPLPPMMAEVAQVEGSLQSVALDGIDLYLLHPGEWFKPADLVDSALVGAKARITLEPEIRIEASKVELVTSSRSTFLGPLLGDKFNAEAIVRGGFGLAPETGFTANGEVWGRGKVAGFQTDHLHGHVALQTGGPGAAGVRVVTTKLAVHAYGGRITTPRVVFRMDGQDDTMLVDGRFRIDDLLAAGPLTSEAVAMVGPVPLLLGGRLSGDLGTAVRLKLDPSKEPNLDLDVALDANLQLARSGLGTPYTAVLPQVHVKGGLAFGLGPGRGPIIDLDDALVHTGTADHTPAQLHKVEWIRASGRLDFAKQDSQLQVAAHVPQLARLLEPMGIRGVRGQVDLLPTKVRGGLDAPQLAGKLRVRNVVAKGYRLDRLDTGIELRGGTLKLTGLQAESEVARVDAEVEVGLFAGNFQTPQQPRMLRVRRLRVTRLDLAKATALAGLEVAIGGMARLDGGDVTLNLDTPKRGMRVTGKIHIDDLAAGGEVFPTVDVSVAVLGQKVVIPDLDVRLPTGKSLTATAAYDLGRQAWQVSARLPMTPLASLSALQAAKVPVRGSVGAVVSAAGDNRTLAVKADIDMQDIGYDLPRTDKVTGQPMTPQRIDLGSAHLGIDKAADGPATFRSEKFFRRFKLLPGSQAEFSHQKPQQVVLKIGTVGAIDPFAVLGMQPPPGMLARIQAEVTTTLDLRPGAPLFRIEAKLPPHGAEIDVAAGLQTMRNTSAMVVTVLPDSVTLGSTWFDLGRHPLELCASYTFANEEAQRKDNLLIFLAGTIDVPRFGPLAETLAGVDLRFDILSDPAVAGDDRADCLQSARTGKGRMRVEGPTDAPRVQGVLQTRASRITPRRFGRDVVLSEGGRIQLSTASNGRTMTITIPRAHPLAGAIEDGRFATWGQAVLRQRAVTGADGKEASTWLPDHLDFTLQGEDIPHIQPKMMTVAVSPNLRFRGSRLGESDGRRMSLVGDVKIEEGNLYQSFDRLASIVGSVRERQVEQSSKPIQETMPWLCEVDLDIRARGNNLEVNSRIPFGQVDVTAAANLRLTGTLCDLRVFDRLEVVQGSGSQFTYALNNLVFEVEHAALDFTGDYTKPHLDVLIKADIPDRSGGTRGRTGSSLGQALTPDNAGSVKVITVTVQITGVWGDPNNFNLIFSSNEGDPPADVLSLIIAGKRLADGGKGGVTFKTDFLVNDVADALRKALLGKIVDNLQLDIDPATGAVTGHLSRRLGRDIGLGLEVEGGIGVASKYTATFDWRLGDRVSLNGLFRRQPDLTSQDLQKSVDVFDGRLRFKVPLE